MAAKKAGRPRKDLAALLVDYRYDRAAGRIYAEWSAFYTNAARPRLAEKAARGATTRFVAHRFKLSARRVEQIISQGNALHRTLQSAGHARGAKADAAQREFREQHTAIYKVLSLLGKPAYKDLLEGCTMEGPARLPKALREFSSAPEATAPDSLQHFAGMLARALLRAHVVAERASPAYSETKIPRRR